MRRALLSTAATASAASPPAVPIPPPSTALPLGFQASAAIANIKKRPALDMALITSRTPCQVAAMYTQNLFQAAPVLVSRERTHGEATPPIHALLMNSGCANACTGEQGLLDAREMVKRAERQCGLPDGAVLVMSTGVIGQPLPMDKVLAGVDALSKRLPQSSPQSWQECAQAFMTTDTFPKLRARECQLPNHHQERKSYRLTGICKGAGMIHPNMATMLCAVFTDARVEREALQVAWRYAMERSFNAISVDGDTSTNDTALVMANGEAGNEEISDQSSPAFLSFRSELTSFCQELAKLIVRDGEGATKFITVQVVNARSKRDAKMVAEAVCKSPLVKTAMFGKDANWGRIVAAMGYSGAVFQPHLVDMYLMAGEQGELPSSYEPSVLHLVHQGGPYEIDEEVASAILQERDVTVRIDLNDNEGGEEEEDGSGVTMWTCDFSHEYISINADYRS